MTSVCDYVDSFRPDRGFIAFRAGLPRVGVDALKVACEHLGGRGCTFGLQLRDQFVNLLWETCLAATKKEQAIVTPPNNQLGIAVNPASPLQRKNSKKQKIGGSSIVAVADDLTDQPLQRDQETQTSGSQWSEEIKKLQSANQKFAETQQQLTQTTQQLACKCTELFELVQRLQCQQGVSDRLLCAVYDQQRPSDDLQPNEPLLRHQNVAVLSNDVK